MKKLKFPKKAIAIIIIAVIGVSLFGYLKTMNKVNAEELDPILREYPAKKGDITAGVDGSGVVTVDKSYQNFIKSFSRKIIS